MARHVFQYRHAEPPVPWYHWRDPTRLPVLPAQMHTTDGGSGQRPERADLAGLSWANNSRHPDTVDATGAAERRRMLQQHNQYPQIQSTAAVPVARVEGAKESTVLAQVMPAGGTKAAGAYRVDGSPV